MTTFAPLKNDTLLRALRFLPVKHTPIWVMRQAGRYLPEYQATRAQAGDFLSLCKNVELATEVTLQPLERFDLDAAILFSDILTIPDAFGMGVTFAQGEGPKLKYTVRSQSDLESLGSFDIGALDYVIQAVSSIRHALGGRVPLIGFSGSPWTLATYIVEGGSSRDFRHIKTMLYQNPILLHTLLTHLSNAVSQYLVAQVDAGAQVLQIFDSWGGVLGYQAFEDFSHAYMKQCVDAVKAIHPDVPIILFTKGGGHYLALGADTQADALGLDWTVPLSSARGVLTQAQRRLTLTHKKMQRPKAIQGNLDPYALYAPKEDIAKMARAMLDDAYDDQKTGYIANLGHGITQWTNPDHVKALVDAVHAYPL